MTYKCKQVDIGDKCIECLRSTAFGTGLYVNRLSDWLFVLGRWVCHCLGHSESLWEPLAKRVLSDGITDLIKKINSNDNDFSLID